MKDMFTVSYVKKKKRHEKETQKKFWQLQILQRILQKQGRNKKKNKEEQRRII